MKQPLLGRSAVADTASAWAASHRDLALAGVRSEEVTARVVLHLERFVEYLTAAGQPRSHRQHHRSDHHSRRTEVTAELGIGIYPKGIKIGGREMKDLEKTRITHDPWHGEWNYQIHPTTTNQEAG